MSLPIETARLMLRRFQEKDLLDVIEFASYPSVAAATPDIVATEEGVRKYLALQNSYRPFEEHKCFDLAIELKAETKVVGLLSAVRSPKQQLEIGYALGDAYRGRGLATEAVAALIDYGFGQLGIHRIQADTSSDNLRSWQLMERLGMRREASLREALCIDGRRSDKLIYGLLADEWH